MNIFNQDIAKICNQFDTMLKTTRGTKLFKTSSKNKLVTDETHSPRFKDIPQLNDESKSRHHTIFKVTSKNKSVDGISQTTSINSVKRNRRKSLNLSWFKSVSKEDSSHSPRFTRVSPLHSPKINTSASKNKLTTDKLRFNEIVDVEKHKSKSLGSRVRRTLSKRSLRSKGCDDSIQDDKLRLNRIKSLQDMNFDTGTDRIYSVMQHKSLSIDDLIQISMLKTKESNNVSPPLPSLYDEQPPQPPSGIETAPNDDTADGFSDDESFIDDVTDPGFRRESDASIDPDLAFWFEDE